MFDSKVKGGIWLIHLQRTTANKFFEEFNRATLVADCLRSRMESTNAVWLVLALTCFGPTLISPHKISHSPFLGLSQWRLPTLIGGFRHELWTQSEEPLSTIRYAARLSDWMSQNHRTRKAYLPRPRPASAHGRLVVYSLCHDLQQADTTALGT